MRSPKGGIKTWLIFILILVTFFGALYYFRNIYAPTKVEVVEEEKPIKGFAVPEISEEEKTELDNQAVNKAMLSGDIEDCEEITYDDELKKQCLDNLNYAKVLRSGDKTQCEALFDPRLKEQCYDKIFYSAAMDSFDESFCEQIKDESLKLSCKNKIQAVLGKVAKSEADCDGITNPALKQECLNNFHFSSSIENLDTGGCSNITSSSLKERCARTIVQNTNVIENSKKQKEAKQATTTEVLSSCSNLSGDQEEKCKDDANFELAFEEKDLSYCDRIGDSQSKELCVKEQSENLNQYYLRKAMATRDESMCNKITKPSLQTLCRDSI